MDGLNLQIEGGYKLSGTVVTKTAKNSAVALLCASLLNKGATTLKNVPKIEEVNRLIEVLESIGVVVKWQGSTLTIKPPGKLRLDKLDQAAATKTRSILMFLGPLIHWEQKFKLPHPGGCKLGERSVRPHLFALENLGVKIKSRHDYYEVDASHIKRQGSNKNREIVLYEAGDTVTENILMAAALIPAATTIKFGANNYMVQDLAGYLRLLGVEVTLGDHSITVRGVAEIDRDVTYCLSEDPIESMLFLAIAATTNSAITIERCPIDFLELELLKLKKMGFKYKASKPYRSKNGVMKLVDIKTRPSKLKALEEKIHPLPFPGINIDNLPFFVPIATQARGTTLIHDWVYENRAIYYMELTKLGADIILADPHRIYIKGPTPLHAAEVICPPALRPAALILIAMLAARGTSILRNIYSINRGYEDLASRLQQLGAKIKIAK